MISLDELESALWGAAVLLRGKINATGYKEYIFPLVFFKRICDVHNEERVRALELSGGDEEFAAQPDNYSFAIPEGCFWEDVRAVTENIGQALVTAWTRIEQANPARVVLNHMVEGLTGIFGKRDHWTNKNVLTDATLSELIEHFSRVDLSLANCPADEMGTAYEYLVGKFADDAGHTAQEFYTNRTVVELMAEILRPQGGESVYDPTCGTGGMLISCIAHCAKQGGNWREIKAYGQEQNALTSAIARMNLFLHGIEEFRIVNDDTLERPAFLDAGRLKTFDVVLANPPYSIKQWNRDLFANDPYGRNFLGTPPQGRADYAFIQHILKSMDPKTGRCAILLPHGVLFREEEREMRRNLVESDLLEAVIGLGPNLFYNSPMEACVMICRANKPAQAKGRVLFINAVNEVTRKNASSNLEPKHIAKILAAYAARASDGVFSHDATRAEIAARGDSLAISLYAHAGPVDSGEKIDLAAALAVFAESSASSSEALDRYVAAVGGQSARLVAVPAFPSVANLSGKCGDLRKVKFGDIAVNSVAKKKPEETDLPHYIGLEHIDPGSFTVSRWGGDVVPIGDKLVMKKGDVLFGKRRAYQRKVAIAPFDGIFSAHGMVLRPKTDVIDARYFPFFIASDQFLNEAIRISVGGLSPTINWKTLKECEFSLPPIDRQRELADLLWAANDLKEAYKKAISTNDEMLKAKFREMFGDNDFKGFLSQAREGKPDESSTKCIQWVPVGEVADVFSGGTPDRNRAEYWQDGVVPWVKTTELKNDFITHTEEKITELGVQKSSAKLMPAKTILVAMYGQGKTRGMTGCLAIPAATNQACACIVARECMEVRFLWMYLILSYEQLRQLANTTSQANLSLTTIKRFKVPLPPLERQREFVAIAEAAEETKTALTHSLGDLEQVMKGLING